MDITLRSFEVEQKTSCGKNNEVYYQATARFSTAEMDFQVRLPREVSEMVLQMLKGEICKASAVALKHLTTETNPVKES